MATRTSKLNSDERTTLVTSTVTVRSPICEKGTFSGAWSFKASAREVAKSYERNKFRRTTTGSIALDLDHVGVMVLRPAMKRQFFAWTRAEPTLSSHTCTDF